MKGVIKIKFGEKKESYGLLPIMDYYDCDYIFLIGLSSWQSYDDIVANRETINKYLLDDYHQNIVKYRG